MTDKAFNGDAHVGDLLSGYLDGELTQQQRQRVSLHLEGCGVCMREFEELSALRSRVGKARLSDAGNDTWRENMNDTTVQLTRGIGWLLFLGGLLVLAGIGVFSFLVDSSAGTLEKGLISAVYLGLGGLFVSVLRQRLIERKSDRYKDVEI